MIRCSDIILSTILMIFLFPFFLLTLVILLIVEGGPIFFTQPRVGKNEYVFNLYKLRSMRVDEKAKSGGGSEDLNLSIKQLKKNRKEFKTTKVNDERITKIGKILRSTSIDELPQLLNIFKGDMSFVGPRPDLPIQKGDYTSIQWKQRCSVRPGLTGLAQIRGRSNVTHSSRLDSDLYWVKNRNFWFYIYIIISTPFAMFKNVN